LKSGSTWTTTNSILRGKDYCICWEQHHHDDRRFDCSEETIGFPYTDEDAVPVEVKAGAIVFFNGYLLHRSLPNYAKTGYRRVLVNHYMSAESLLPWHTPRQGERMATADMRDIVMIAGRDPYGFKGIESVAQPHIRPDGQGGCGDPKQNVKIESRENSALPYDDDADDEE
jgi:phytanoyl-CoA hydroxylase